MCKTVFSLEEKMKILKKTKRIISLKKAVTIFTTICFVVSTICSQAVYAVMPLQNNVLTKLDFNNISETLIPFNLGRITDAYFSNSKGDIIINIQDLHSHKQTQENIYLILSLLDTKFGLSDIYIEGATESINTQWLSNIEDQNSKQKVLNNLLNSGRLSGGEYFAVKSNKNTILKGLEDKTIYSKNFKELNKIYNKETEIKNYISLLNNLFDKKAVQYYSKENKKINEIIQDYKDGRIKTNHYINILLQKAQTTNINLSKYKNIIKFTKILSKQQSFNSKQLSNELKELLIDVEKSFSKEQIQDLTKKAAKKEFELEFYFDLLKKANDLKLLNLKKYKNSYNFFEYLILNQTLNIVELSKDEKTFIYELKTKLAANQAEKEILFLQHNLGILSNYLENKISAQEYEQFLENIANFKLLWRKYIDIDNLTDITKYFGLVDAFYKNNIERNRIFIKKLLDKNTNQTYKDGLRIRNNKINHEEKVIQEISKGKKVHVVITGGFHTYGFNKLLEDENTNYIVITPNVTDNTIKSENAYKDIFNEQYDITNTTFANRPVSEIISLLNKGEIKDIRPVGEDVEIEYVSGEIFSLKDTKQEQSFSTPLLSKEQAKLAADIIIDIQTLKQQKRENNRATKADSNVISSQDLEQALKANLAKITDLDLKNTLEEMAYEEISDQQLTKTGLRNTIWYKVMTRLGWISLRESLVAIFEQKDFDNIFMEEILGKISDRNERAREKFLEEHKYFGTREVITTQLNYAVTSIIDAMNNVYKIVFSFSRIHFIAQLAAKIAGIKNHKKYNVNIYKLSKNNDALLTKDTESSKKNTYQVKFTVYFKLHNTTIEYKTGDDFFTTAPSKAKAFNNAVQRAAVEILEKHKLDRSQFKLTMFLIRKKLGSTGFDINKNIIQVEDEKEPKTIISKKTNKPFTMRNHKYGEYPFNIVIPGLNDTPELSAFQNVYAKSPRQAIFEVVYQLCTATEKGELIGGKFEDLKLSKKNINKLYSLLSDMYIDSKLPEIIKNVRANSAPALNTGVTVNINRQLKIGEKVYNVIIPNFNDREGLEPYQTVCATDEKQAIEQAVLAIIKAKERKEIRGGYYNYRAINRDNKDAILELLYKNESVKIQDITEQELKEKNVTPAQQSDSEKTLKDTVSVNNVNKEIFENTIINSIKALQRLTYSVLFSDNTEYTMVADANDLSRIKKAEILSKSGIKVNLVLTGDTTLIREADSRISTVNGQLAFCLIETPNKNLTIYGYDDKLSDTQLINPQEISEQNALIAMLKHVTDQSEMSVKILDLPDNLNQNIVTTDIEENSKDLFTAIGVGKTTLNLFSDALKNKKRKTDDMFIKPSLVASNLSREQIESFSLSDINRLTEQGVTTLIIDADDKLLKEKELNLKEIIQTAHDKGLKIMFNFGFDLQNMTVDSLKQWISEFNEKIKPFKENGGIDGFQADLSKCGELANTTTTLLHFSALAQIVNEQNVGSFLSMKMPESIYPTEYLIIFNNAGIKLVADYDSPLVSIGKSVLKTENMIINISADKNGNISIPKLASFFENNKVSMISFDLPILESIDTTNGFSFKGMTITKFISSIFETTPEGQTIRGINKGRNFVIDRDSVIDEDILNTISLMYKTDDFDIEQINTLLKTNFDENLSKYELKGFIEGLLETTELKKQNAVDISFDKKDYTNLLMKTLLDYRLEKGISFNKDLSSDIEETLITDNFSNEFKPKIEEVYNILNGRFNDKADTVINILSSLKDNQQLNSQERTMVLEGLLLLLLGYAKQDVIDMGNLTDDNNIANIKAILRAA